MAETMYSQLHLLYHAGKVTFPDRAEALAASLDTIGEVHSSWRAPTVRAGSPDALVQAMAINQTVYGRLRRAVLTWQDVATALVAIADGLVEVDEHAAAVARGIHFRLDELPMPDLVEPPTLGDAS